MEFKNLVKLIFDYQRIPKQKRKRTYLEIIGYPHLENVSSNILQFFLNPKNEHEFNDLVLKSLVGFVSKNTCINFEYIDVIREYSTLKKNRLDIVIKTDRYIIGIENKVFHYINNDLSDYKATIESLCSEGQIPINIILSLNNLSDSSVTENGFITITYEQLFEKIILSYGNYFDSSNPTYYIFLMDFIKSIRNLNSSTMENNELWSFFKQNSEVMQELVGHYNKYIEDLNYRIIMLRDNLPKEKDAPSAIKQWISTKDRLVYDYLLKGLYKIVSETIISVNGWEIQLFGRNGISTDYLITTMLNDELFEKFSGKYSIRNDRVLFNQFDIDEDFEDVVRALKTILSCIEEFKKKIEV